MTSKLKKDILFVVIVLVVPITVVALYMLNGATVALVHNEGRGDTKISLVISSGGEFERTPDKPLKARSYTLVVFYPRTTGDLEATCLKNGHWKGFPIGRDAPDTFLAESVTLASCDRMVSHHDFSL